MGLDDGFTRYRIEQSLNTGKCSDLLISQLCDDEFRAYNILDHIIEEIAYLEGLNTQTLTKPATQYKYPPLKGLWHKHYHQAQHLIKNSGLYWGINDSSKIQDYGKLDKMISNTIKECNLKTGDILTDEFFARLSHKLIFEPIENRVQQSKATGDWIIFAKNNNVNYYLTVAFHNESDEDIYNRIKKYLPEIHS